MNTPERRRLIDRHALLMGYIAAVVTVLLVIQIVQAAR